MGRGEQRKTRLGPARYRRFDIHSVLVHGHRETLDPFPLNGRRDQREAGIFHPHAIPRAGQRLQDQAHRLRIARGNKYLLRLALNAAGEAQVVGDGLAQHSLTRRIPKREIEARLGTQTSAGQPRPQRTRKEIQRGQAHLKRLRLMLVAVLYGGRLC